MQAVMVQWMVFFHEKWNLIAFAEILGKKSSHIASVFYRQHKKRKTHLLGDVLAAFQVMISIRQNLRLYDGNNAVLAKESRCCQDNANVKG